MPGSNHHVDGEIMERNGSSVAGAYGTDRSLTIRCLGVTGRRGAAAHIDQELAQTLFIGSAVYYELTVPAEARNAAERALAVHPQGCPPSAGRVR